MSFIFSRVLAVEYLQGVCLGIDVLALSKSTRTPGQSSAPDSEMGAYQDSQCSETLEPLMLDLTGGELTSWLEDFPAKPIPPQLREETLRMISGRKCGGWWQMSLPGTYLPRTCNDVPLTGQRTSLKRWVTRSELLPLERRTWVVTMFGSDIGYLHTPTCTANYAAPSMQKWPSAREFVRAFGKPTPTNHEWLMGWPIGWSDLQSLETGKYQQWLQQHGIYSGNEGSKNGGNNG